jgi:CBS domain-containing protein
MPSQVAHRSERVLGTVAKQIRVSELVTHKQQGVWTISLDASVFDAVHSMSEHGIGALPVVDGERLVGIVSERDCARKLVLSGKSPVHTLVRDIMSTELVTVNGDYTVEQCMQLMTAHRIRHLPVMKAGALFSIVSIGDLVYEVIAQQQRALDELERYVAG